MEKIKEKKPFSLDPHICNPPKLDRFEGSVSLKGWKNGRMKNVGMMEKCEEIKYFNFPPFYLVESEK